MFLFFPPFFSFFFNSAEFERKTQQRASPGGFGVSFSVTVMHCDELIHIALSLDNTPVALNNSNIIIALSSFLEATHPQICLCIYIRFQGVENICLRGVVVSKPPRTLKHHLLFESIQSLVAATV